MPTGAGTRLADDMLAKMVDKANRGNGANGAETVDDLLDRFLATKRAPLPHHHPGIRVPSETLGSARARQGAPVQAHGHAPGLHVLKMTANGNTRPPFGVLTP